jgi:hypothetical protein
MSRKQGQLIPVTERRQFAYQSEPSYPGASIQSHPSRHDHSEEAKKYIGYELTIHKATDTALTINLRKKRADIVEQRKANGAAVIAEVYQTTIDFAELVNRIFSPGCDVYLEEEHFPDAIRQAMKNAYNPDKSR